MSARRLATGGAALLAAAGLGAFAATVFGGEDEPAHQRAVNAGKVELELAGGNASARVTEPVARRGKRKPVVTHLITTTSIPAYYQGQPIPDRPPSTGSTFTKVKCPKGTGLPIGGGVITNGAPDLAPDVISRFNPNTFRAPRNRYFIGVRNDSLSQQSFRATLICGKGMRVR